MVQTVEHFKKELLLSWHLQSRNERMDERNSCVVIYEHAQSA